MRQRNAGKVYIVGAGPGDPELITVKAMRLIQQADVILYDRLVNKELLEYRASHAILIDCGKAPGAHTMPQEQIQKTLVRYAQEGCQVVRLKGGDPLIFGRGSEEALELAEWGIPYEFVPGITSAIGAASSSGIPLTHRGLAASFACVTGSRCHGPGKDVRWDLLAHGVDTLAIYMGVSELPSIREELLRHGKAASTPVALIERGTTASQRVIVGTLADIHTLAVSMKLSNPALIIIGEVVRVREQLLRAEQHALSLIG
ncbi:uroporphyrinogen-III C-methyltransferase [Paenibacillus soyae]|uniref:Uroporphyrinogen-III C-methyltransferase n=1 Tax=Paenibacillus soyae TaxID=2969249 RepID=A0A9X2MQD5_9BACL|nr:uroporphyrinogen-III C-methyltransferase [Paenibacillus soyae]MCR2804495.1 uroporphyrinogen-III C-methyltransferase [Paenibacillus soyae]